MARRTIQDDLLGTLRWNEHLRDWEGSVPISGDRVQFILDTSNSDDMESALAAIRGTVETIQRNEKALRCEASKRLLQLYNRKWSAEGQPIDEETFVSRMKLEGLNLASDGSAELFYGSGQMFADHAIRLSLDEQGAVQEIMIAG